MHLHCGYMIKHYTLLPNRELGLEHGVDWFSQAFCVRMGRLGPSMADALVIPLLFPLNRSCTITTIKGTKMVFHTWRGSVSTMLELPRTGAIEVEQRQEVKGGEEKPCSPRLWTGETGPCMVVRTWCPQIRVWAGLGSIKTPGTNKFLSNQTILSL